jgi:ADP-ribose pyrophosphatase
MAIKFCNQCGHKVQYQTPEDDNKTRAVCQNCFYVQYENPLIVTGCIIEHQGRIVLGKRTIEPRKNCWNVPAGFLEIGESSLDGAIREVKEEVLADVKNIKLFGVYNIIQRSQIHIYYRAQLDSPNYGAGAETSETQLFLPEDIPWDNLAFPVNITALERYVKEMKSGEFTIQEDDILIDYETLRLFDR